MVPCGAMERQFSRTGVWILFLTCMVAPVNSQQPPGFVSIDCGGDGGRDSVTDLVWSTDLTFLDTAQLLYDKGVAARANVSYENELAPSQDNAKQLKTAAVFRPGISARSKYCYKFTVEYDNFTSNNYLVRAMFPSSALASFQIDVPLNTYGTRFYFTVDSTFISTIDLNASSPQTVEVVVTPLDTKMYICLVPLEDKSSMPAISSLELRPLKSSTYSRASAASNVVGDTKLQTTYLMTVNRWNFGGDESLPAVRYPADEYDRLWYAAPMPEGKSSEFTNVSSSNATSESGSATTNETPFKVLNTAWEGVSMTSEISITFDIKEARAHRRFPNFWMDMVLYDFEDRKENTSRFANIVLEQREPGSHTSRWASAIIEFYPSRWYSEKQRFLGDLAIFRLSPNGSSNLPAMVNSVELYGEFEALTERTAELDAKAIEGFSDSFAHLVDTAGDPCLPVPWAWLICSIEIPPRITQINLTNKGVGGELPTRFGSMDRLTVLDLSNNSFQGGLPSSLAQVVTLRALNLADNHLDGELPDFDEKSLKNLEFISLRNNNFSGSLLALVKALDDTVFSLDLSDNSFSGAIPAEISLLKNLNSLDLSNNNLSGSLNDSLFKLPDLKQLDLHDNFLQGIVPDEIWSTSSKLVDLNLLGNDFTELNLTTWSLRVLENMSFDVYHQQVWLIDNNIRSVILPSQDLFEKLSKPSNANADRGFILLALNPWCEGIDDRRNANATLVQRYLCRYGEEQTFWAPFDSNSKDLVGKRTLIIMGVTTGLLVLLMACILIFFLWRMWKRMNDLRQIQEALAKDDVRPPFYKYEELKAATGDFSQQKQLGKGAFGAVYKAELGDGSTVAVKRLFPTVQNVADFLKEMVLITGIKHRHLVQLKGCCVRDKQRMLVYEYAENKNLAEALWGRDRLFDLNWEQRLKICVGIARGLCYLHEELHPKIIHRDIKPQNILLDKDLNAKIADFGLARPVDEDATQMATNFAGTLGYFSPEYATLGMFTEKLDVYSYGVLVLEIVSGRKCINLKLPEDEIYLRTLGFRLYEEGKLVNIAQEGLLEQTSEDEVMYVLKTALSCLQDDPNKRPSMSQVVNMLSGNSEVAIDIVNGLKEQRLSYDDLYDTFSMVNDQQEREDGALLFSSSSSNAQQTVELSDMRPR